MNRIAFPSLAHLVTAVVVAGCGASLTDPGVTPDPNPAISNLTRAVGDTVTLEIDESVTFEPAGAEVTFLRLVGDSRCPIGVTCVWEGDAEVEVRVVREADETTIRLHTTLEPRSVAVGAFVLELVDVLPYPREDPLADPAMPSIVLTLQGVTD